LGLIEQGWDRQIQQTSYPTNVDAAQLGYILRVKGQWMRNGGAAYFPLQNQGGAFRATTDAEGLNRIPCFSALSSATDYGGFFYGYIRVPSLSDISFTSVYIWCGNQTATAPAASSDFGKDNTFADHLCFLPFNEGTSPFIDLSANGVSWAPNGGGTEPFVGTADEFFQYTYYDTTRRLQADAQIVTDTFHIGFYMRSTQVATGTGDWQNGHALIDADMAAANSADWGVSLMNGGAIAFGTGDTVGADITIITDTVDPVNVGGWFRIDINWNSITGAVEIFINGVLRGSGTGNTGNRNSTNPIIGNNYDFTRVYVGDMSELEFTDEEIVVSYAKIKTEFWNDAANNQALGTVQYVAPLDFNSSIIDGTVTGPSGNFYTDPGETRIPVAAVVTVNRTSNPGGLAGAAQCISYVTGDEILFNNNGHNDGTTAGQNVSGTTSVVYLTDGSATIHTGMSFLTFVPGGIHIWCWTFTAAISVNIKLIYGVPVFLDVFSAAGETNYNAIPFRANYIETLNFRDVYNAGAGIWYISKGFATPNNQGSISVYKVDGTDVLNTVIRNDAITQGFDEFAVPNATVEVTGWNESTIDLTIVGTMSTNTVMPALIMRLPDGNVQVGFFDNQTSTGEHTIPIGFKPSHMDIMTSPATAYNTTNLSDPKAGTISFGSHNVDVSDTYSTALKSDGASNVDSSSISGSGLTTVDSTGAVIAQANIVEFYNEGAKINWTVSDATASKGIFAAFKQGGPGDEKSNLNGNLNIRLLGGFQ